MNKVTPGVFRTQSGGANGTNFQDGQLDAGQYYRTTGGILIDSLSAIQPPVQKVWTIYAFSVVAQCLFLGNPGNINPSPDLWGLQPIIYAGLLAQGQPTNSVVSGTPVPWLNANVPLPNDMSMVSKLFDPEQDSLSVNQMVSGSFSDFTLFPYKQTSLILPTPLALPAGSSPSIFLQVMPSVMANLILVILNARWAISYDSDETLQ